MNAFQRKMAEQVALISTLVMAINSIGKLRLDVEFTGRFERLTVRVNNPEQKVICRDLGKHRVYYVMFIETFLTTKEQEYPFPGGCTIEQMVDVLHQIRQALIEGRTDHESHKHTAATNSQHPATTGMDERNGTDGSFLTPAASLCHGSVKGTGGQPSGAVSSMA